MMSLLKRLLGSAKNSTPDYVAAWRRILIGGESQCWVVFRHGTVVIVTEPAEDLRAQATDLMAEWGAVHAGSSAGDFSILELAEQPGWVVTCHHDAILTYVDPSEVSRFGRSEVAIGLRGRDKRDQDARELGVLHVEDGRGHLPVGPGPSSVAE